MTKMASFNESTLEGAIEGLNLRAFTVRGRRFTARL